MILWKRVPGFKDYEASNDGRVRSIAREVLYKTNGVLRSKKFKRTILKAGVAKNGYLVVNLTKRNGSNVTKYVHEIVAITWIGPRPAGLEILHYDDNKLNNRKENLRYGTKLENYMDAVRNKKVKGPTLSERDIQWIRGHKSLPASKLAKLFKVSSSTIRLILNKEK